MFIESFEDTTIIVLVIAAVISLAVGMYEDPKKGWLEGCAILFSVMLVAVVTATNNYNKEQQFRKLNAIKDDGKIGVLRDGKVHDHPIREILVGDIIVLNAGDKVPADGILLAGSDVVCNESALTGESEDKTKSYRADKMSAGAHELDRFLLSGTSLSTGYGQMLVIAVGASSRWGKTKAKLSGESPDTPLQEKLEVLAGQIGNIGLASAVATFLAMLYIWLRYPATRKADANFFDFLLEAFIMGVTIVVVAVPEGLPLAVTLSLAYSTKKMQKDNNLIRVLAACETMGNATNICSDKTGTLTENRMTVTCGYIAGTFYENLTSLENQVGSFSESTKNFFCEGISVNTTAFLSIDPASEDTANPTIIVNGSKTEGALLMMIKNIFLQDYQAVRTNNFIESRGDKLFTFTSDRKRMSVLLLKEPTKASGILYTKGASEVIVGLCNQYVDMSGKIIAMSREKRLEVEECIANMAKNALRTITLAHRAVTNYKGTELIEDMEKDLILDAIVGIKDPLRPEVAQAVQECQAAGIFVRMVTGDNIETAVAIAKECGIYTEGGIAIEGPTFRKMKPSELDELLPRLQVLARSSPEDKYTLVSRLNGNALPATQAEWEQLHPQHDWETEKDLLLPGKLSDLIRC
jgi:P-type Ca2+ transporter type 2C